MNKEMTPTVIEATVVALKHTDVRGKVLYYLRIFNKQGDDHLINIGEKTFKAVEELAPKQEPETTKEKPKK